MAVKREKQTVSPLKIWRVSKNLMQAEASTLLGLRSQAHYSALELGTNLPRWAFLQDLERRTGQPGLAAAYVVWFFDIGADQLRSILAHQETGGIDTQLRSP